MFRAQGDTHKEVVRVGFLALLAQSVMVLPTAIFIFGLAITTLFHNEGRTNFANEARGAVEAPIGDSSRIDDGTFVSVTGELSATQPVGDPVFIEDIDAVAVYRVAQTYAWNESVSETSKRRIGGSRDVELTYEYTQGWTDFVQPTDSLRYPDGHTNIQPIHDVAVWVGLTATIGDWSMSPQEATMLAFENAELEELPLRDEWQSSVIDEGWLYSADPATPRVGDQRFQFMMIRDGVLVTAFADAHNGTLRPHLWAGEYAVMPVVPGPRDGVISLLDAEYAARGWIIRILGFVALWFSIFLLTGPLHAVMDIIPPLGIATRLLAGLVAIPLALLIGGLVTMFGYLVSHPLALAFFGLLFAGWVHLWLQSRSEQREGDRVRELRRQGVR